MKTNIFTVLISALLLAGCANTGANYRPIIDSKNVDLNRYEADLVECQHYAEQKGGAGEKAAIGAGAGAVLGGRCFWSNFRRSKPKKHHQTLLSGPWI
jgi:outer membrane murein-binding lipoprotein Lpp